MELATRKMGPLEIGLIRIASVDIGILYLCTGLIAVVLLAFLNPAFMPTDENRHFYRAWQLSNLDFRGVVEGDKAGAVLPSAMVDFVESLVELPDGATPFSRHARHLPAAARVDPAEAKFVAFTEAASYSPLPYLPQIAAIRAARALDLRPLGILQATRLFNGLCALLLVACALRILPCGKPVLFIAALLPMNLFLFASASADAAMISTVFLFTAIAARATQRRRWTQRDVVTACLTGAVFCSLKPAYAPILLLGLPAALDRAATRHILIVHAILVGVIVGLTALWLGVLSARAMPQYVNVNPAAQLASLIFDPLNFASRALNTVWIVNGFWMLMGIGLYGNSSLFLPNYMYLLPFLALSACLATPRSHACQIGAIQIAWRLFLLAASMLLVMLALFIFFTPDESAIIQGVQGRYFLPFAALAASTLAITCPSISCPGMTTALAPRDPQATPNARLSRVVLIACAAFVGLSAMRLTASPTGRDILEITSNRVYLPVLGFVATVLFAICPRPGLSPALLASAGLAIAITEALLTPLQVALAYEVL